MLLKRSRSDAAAATVAPMAASSSSSAELSASASALNMETPDWPMVSSSRKLVMASEAAATWTTGRGDTSAARRSLRRHGQSSQTGIADCSPAATATGSEAPAAFPLRARTLFSRSSAVAPVAAGAAAVFSGPLWMRSTSSCARSCSSEGNGLQVLRSRMAVEGIAKAMRHKHASGDTKLQDSSKPRASRSRHITRDLSAPKLCSSSGRCLDPNRSHNFRAASASSKGASE
mmetsp:Transcript_51775/g.168290  ORF Transcript_51775/g.168290 Transcript_51775/m.168290 type:complete len:231 (-) Transcript_51775:1436-2128(-)